MITINGIQIDFNLTSPSDLLRYENACKIAEEKAPMIQIPTVDAGHPDYMRQCANMMNQELKAFGDLIDDIFGEGIAHQILGNNPKLDDITDIYNQLQLELERQGRDFGKKFSRFVPNRASR